MSVIIYTVGYFRTITEATAARRAAELKYWGELAPTTEAR